MSTNIRLYLRHFCKIAPFFLYVRSMLQVTTVRERKKEPIVITRQDNYD